jgi:cytochrome oxidase Cu insertion factor (SCO1/SenC/PrrC family)
MKLSSAICAAAALGLALSAASFPLLSSPTARLKEGDKAPGFELPDQNNKMVRLSDYLGKKNVILAFYIKASTSG